MSTQSIAEIQQDVNEANKALRELLLTKLDEMEVEFLVSSQRYRRERRAILQQLEQINTAMWEFDAASVKE